MKQPWYKRLAERSRKKGNNRIILDRESNDPYLERFYLHSRWWTLGIGRVVIHRFWRSDFDKAWHDHPWMWGSLVLEGGYYEHRPDKNGNDKREWREPGSFAIRTAKSLHYVELENEGEEVWTLFFMFTPAYREWGFVDFVTKKWTQWEEFLDARSYKAKARKKAQAKVVKKTKSEVA